jgi:hypothetical protein
LKDQKEKIGLGFRALLWEELGREDLQNPKAKELVQNLSRERNT